MTSNGHSSAAIQVLRIEPAMERLVHSGDLARFPGDMVKVLAAVLGLTDPASGALPDVPALSQATQLTHTQVRRALAGLTRHGYLPLAQAEEGSS
jgi:hypothetical protein